MDNDRLLYLLTRKASGEITLEERRELSARCKAGDADAQLAAGMQELLGSSLTYSNGISPGTVDNALAVLHKKMHEAEQEPSFTARLVYLKTWAIAASILALITIGAFCFLQTRQQPLRTGNMVTTRKGSKTNMVLPDGTKVWVNADTKLSYGKEFGNGTREVTLAGEAYFDVTKDRSRPFIVHTATMDVRVLGTAFNVRAYGDEADAQTTLIRGSVEVLLKKHGAKKIMLSPSEKIVVQNNPAGPENTVSASAMQEVALLKVHTNADSLSAETQWTRNRLVFDQEKLEDIIPVLERWYNVSVELKGNIKSDHLYSGTFENDSLEDVLESLKTIGGFRFAITKDRVVIF
ncbi:MAG: DUF4974 domain-containing protein [Niabella sp.]